MYDRCFWAPGTSKDWKFPLSFRQILSVYFCATEVGMPFLQNELLSLIYQLTLEDRKGLLSEASFIYEKTKDRASPLRCFLLDFVVDHGCFTDNDPVLYDKLLKDVLEHFQTLRKLPGALMYEEDWIKEMNKNFCHLYHQHDQDIDEDDVDDDPDCSGMIYHLKNFNSPNLIIDDADAASNTSWSSDDTGQSLSSGLEVDMDLDHLMREGENGSGHGSYHGIDEGDDKDNDDREDIDTKDES